MNEIPLAEYRQQIVNAIDDGRYAEAVVHGRHILESYPKDVHAYWLLGRAMFEAGQDEQASDMFKRVLSADPDRMLAWVGLSELAERQGDLEAAIGHLERAFELATDNDGIASHLRHLYGELEGRGSKRLQLTGGALARLYLRGDLLSRAIAELRGLLEEHPDRVDLRMALAEALWRSGDRTQASHVCQEILQVQPFNLTANLILGEVWASAGRPEGELYLERAEELDPENEAAQELFGPNSPLPPKDPQISPADYDATARPRDLSEIGLLPGELEAALIHPDESLTRRPETPLWLQETAEDAVPEHSGGTDASVSETSAEAPLRAEDVNGDAIAQEGGIAERPVDDTMEGRSPLSGSTVRLEQQERSVAEDAARETGQRHRDEDQEGMITEATEEFIAVAEDNAEAFDERSSVPEEVDTGEMEGSDDLEPADIPDWLRGLVPVEQKPHVVPGTGALTALLDEETTEEEVPLPEELEETEDLLALLEAEGMTSDSDVLQWLEHLTEEKEADPSHQVAEDGQVKLPGTAPGSEFTLGEVAVVRESERQALEEAKQQVIESPETSEPPTEAEGAPGPTQDDERIAVPDWLESEIPRDAEAHPIPADIDDADLVARLEGWGVGEDLPGWLDVEELPYGPDVLAWLEQLSEDVEEELRREVDAGLKRQIDAFVEQPERTADTASVDVEEQFQEEMAAEVEAWAEGVVEEPEPTPDAAVAELEEELRREMETPLAAPVDAFVEHPEPTPDAAIPDREEELEEEVEAEVEPWAEEVVEEPEPSLDAAVAHLEEELRREMEAPLEPPLEAFVDQPEPTPDGEEELEEEFEAEVEPWTERVLEEPEPTLDAAVAELGEEFRREMEAPLEPPLDAFVQQPEPTPDAAIPDGEEELEEEVEAEVEPWAEEIAEEPEPSLDAALADLEEELRRDMEAPLEPPVDEFVEQPEPIADTAIAAGEEELEEEVEAEVEAWAEEVVEEPEPAAETELASAIDAETPEDEGVALEEPAEAAMEGPAERPVAELARIPSPPSFEEEPVEDLRDLIGDRRAHLEGHLGDDHARLELGRLLWEAAERDEAIEAYDTLIEHGEPLDEVISDLEEYTKQWSDPWLKRALGDAYFRADRLQDALDVYRKALADL